MIEWLSKRECDGTTNGELLRLIWWFFFCGWVFGMGTSLFIAMRNL